MLERERRPLPAAIDNHSGDQMMMSDAAMLGAGETAVCEIDNELQAAIEYKIAACGVNGAETVIDLLNVALRRLAR